MGTAPKRDWVSRATEVASSPAVNTLVGVIGLAIPIAAWVNNRPGVKNALLGAETVLLIAVVLNHWWLHRVYVRLRRASSRTMSDSKYFDLFRSHFEGSIAEEYEMIADGHLQVYSTEVPRISALLLNTLTESECQPRRVLATDLTTDPQVLTTRTEYITATQKLITSGGTFMRIYICWEKDLSKQAFAAALLPLVDYHRSLGVKCGLAVRDRLRADQAIDFVVITGGAVLVEEEQGDSAYLRGRSSIYFKNISRWADRFTSIWGDEATSPAVLRLTAYETAARPMLTGSWDTNKITTALGN